ncbi:MAG: Gfo/Idh/MocA family protein, partial [Acidimicrobiales bacterium]
SSSARDPAPSAAGDPAPSAARDTAPSSARDTAPPPLRWGILSTAKIAREYLIPAIDAAPHCRVTAVASRDRARAEAFGRDHGIDRCFASYEELIADPDVDVIYNPLPNHLHAEFTLKAAEAGKHVLCEKPFTMDLPQAERLVADLAELETGVEVMEGFMYQFHPQWEAVFRLVAEGRIGRPVAVQTWFSYFGDDPNNIRNIAATGGGALMDIGCYAIHSARRLFGHEPHRVRGTMEIHPGFGVDVTTSAVLDFPDGQATFTVSTQSDTDQRVHIIGTEGRIEITRPFNALADREMIVRVGRGLGATYGEPLETFGFGPADQYAIMVERFASALLAGEPAPVGLDDAVANMAVIDAIRRSHGADGQ